MQREAHQAGFARLFDVGYDEQWLLTQRAVLKHAHASRTLGEDHPPVWRPNNGPWHFQTADYCFDFEFRARLSRTRDFTRATTGRGLTTTKSDDHCEREHRIRRRSH